MTNTNNNLAFNEALDQVQSLALDYLHKLDKAPTSYPTFNQPFSALSAEGLGLSETINLFRQQYHNAMPASAGPRYYGFVIGGSTPAAVVGDMLTPVYDQNVLSAFGPGDTAGYMELHTISLLRNLFNLPEDFNGAFVTGATMSNFTCLAVARQWAGARTGIDIAREGLAKAKLTVVSATPHSSAIKCLSMLGMGSTNFQQLGIVPGTERLEISSLEAVLASATSPVILISSAGTVNTVDFDDMKAIASLHKKYKFWWHVDGAFGGFAACSPSHRHLTDGWEEADSIAIDLHKWMNVPYDSAVFFTRKEYETLQRQVFQHSNAPYLGNPDEKFSLFNFVPESSRRFRALPAWFSLMAYGRSGFQEIVENNVSNARMLGERLEQSGNFQLVAPVLLNTACFTVKGRENDAAYMKRFLTEIVSRGRVFMTPTIYQGKHGIRAAFVNWLTSDGDVNITFNELQEVFHLLK